jgi:glycosyltransferase involved in cell wall biosynthesis
MLDTPVARETAGAAAYYVSPAAGPAAVAAALVTCLTDTDTRRNLLDQAPAVLGQYQWPATAARTLAALEECARGR